MTTVLFGVSSAALSLAIFGGQVGSGPHFGAFIAVFFILGVGGVLGAVLGAVAGYFFFDKLWDKWASKGNMNRAFGFMLLGALLGIILIGLIMGLMQLLYEEWDNHSFRHICRHLEDFIPLIFIVCAAIGGFLGGRKGFRGI